MNRSELGKKIKEARLAKKMTQTEVVGNFITRNMLSQIESGVATPSLNTLEYLAGVLDIPVQTLIPDSREAQAETESDADKLCEAKQLFRDGEYDRCFQIAKTLADSKFSDEAAALDARCYFNMAVMAEKNGDYGKAAFLVQQADELADVGIYASRDIKIAGALVLNRVAEKLTK